LFVVECLSHRHIHKLTYVIIKGKRKKRSDLKKVIYPKILESRLPLLRLIELA
jgi:hypothetical protein